MGSSLVGVIKDVPGEVCNSCHEPYMTGESSLNLLVPFSHYHFPIEILA
jgi:hypothetical protein